MIGEIFVFFVMLLFFLELSKRCFSNRVERIVAFIPSGIFLCFVNRPIAQVLNLYWNDAKTKEFLIAGIVAFVVASSLKKWSDLITDLAQDAFESFGRAAFSSKPRSLKDFTASTDKKLSASERERIVAYHESGHVLAKAFYDPATIAHLFASVETMGSSGGRCEVGYWSDTPLSEKFFFAQMLNDLAGMEAENHRFKDRFLGSSEDFRKWQKKAEEYIANGFCVDALFFSSNNFLEDALPSAALNALLAQQREILRKFFEENSKVLDELSELLFSKKRLDHEDLMPFVDEARMSAVFQ